MSIRIAPYSRTLVAGDATSGFNVLWLPSTSEEWIYTNGLTKPHRSVAGIPGLKLFALTVSCADSAGNRRMGYTVEVEIFSSDNHTVYKLPVPVARFGYPISFIGEIDCPYGLGVTVMAGTFETDDSFGITVGVGHV